MKSTSAIRVVAEKPVLRPIVEPTFNIIDASVEKEEIDGEIKWILSATNIDGRIFKYELNFLEPK